MNQLHYIQFVFALNHNDFEISQFRHRKRLAQYYDDTVGNLDNAEFLDILIHFVFVISTCDQIFSQKYYTSDRMHQIEHYQYLYICFTDVIFLHALSHHYSCFSVAVNLSIDCDC